MKGIIIIFLMMGWMNAQSQTIINRNTASRIVTIPNWPTTEIKLPTDSSSNFIKNIPGAIVLIDSNVFIRNNEKTKWILIKSFKQEPDGRKTP